MKQLGIEPDSTVYGAILASMGEGIMFADRENRIVCINAAAERIRGVKAANFLGRNLMELHAPQARGRIAAVLEAMRQGSVASHSRPLRSKGRLYENSYFPIRDAAGSFLGTLMISRDITEREQLKEENSVLREQIQAEQGCGEMVALSPAMQPVFQVIRSVAPLDSTVLIGGESGTGKELVARAVHQLSRRAAAPLVKVNCAALPEQLLESELFGYEKGAFTGAVRERKGKFEQAHHGTIFLDEIGEMPFSSQAKLLRVLQEKTVERIGGCREIRVDVRIIAATNRDLGREVALGRFREDLFYRLNVIPLQLPPLRDRREDILPLAERFCRGFASQMGKPPLQFSPQASRLLLDYHYPGNVRELKNVIERCVALACGSTLRCEDLPFAVDAPVVGLPGPLHQRARSGKARLSVQLNGYEEQLIDQALEQAGQHRGEAARLLGVSRKTLWKKLKQREAAPNVTRR